MMDYNELKNAVKDTVNENDDYYDDSQIEEITDEILDLDGFDLEKGDDIGSINGDIFWELVENIDDHTEPKAYTESEWREPMF